jgi:hypothetical protein
VKRQPIIITVLATLFILLASPKQIAVPNFGEGTSVPTIKPPVVMVKPLPQTTLASVEPLPVPEPAPVVEPTPAPTTYTTPVISSHTDLMAAAGIAPGDYDAVEYIISHESGWRPDATNASGAHGLPQALPYSKTGCGWVDAVCQLQWANGYAQQRYGGWWPAYTYWVNNRYW